MEQVWTKTPVPGSGGQTGASPKLTDNYRTRVLVHRVRFMAAGGLGQF